jgi:hypothetical protein
VWRFEVKGYLVEIRFNASWVIFIVYGDPKKFPMCPLSPYNVRRFREEKRKRKQLFGTSKRTRKFEKELWKKFVEENDIMNWEQSEWDADRKIQVKWADYVDAYNEAVIGIGTWEEWADRYGVVHINANIRHARRALEKFVKNMLAPIYIRDVAYNIKGEVKDMTCMRYDGNIEVRCVNKRR